MLRQPVVLIAATLLVTHVAALPNPLERLGNWARAAVTSQSRCLNDAQAKKIANNYQTLLTNYSEAFANASLTTNFTDFSDSVNELINNGCNNGPQPLGSATFTSRVAFEQGQGMQPPIPFEQLKVWHTCDTVFVRWVSKQTPQQVTGILALETLWSRGKFLISTVFSEFNSGAWLRNIGVFTPMNCTA